jgi:plastocyanin
MRQKAVWGTVIVLAGALTTAACGGGSSSPSSPTPPTGGGGGSTTITITASGVSPQTLTVPAGTRVTFMNNDNRSHEMNSDPHPEHGDCPAIDEVGRILAGQSKQTGNLNDVRTCGYHDHNLPSNSSLMGRIIVQ